MKLPGSRKDIIRTQKLSGPSPVGGAAGGTEGRTVMSLDEFEIQAAHYNIACAYARLGKVTEVRDLLIVHVHFFFCFCLFFVFACLCLIFDLWSLDWMASSAVCWMSTEKWIKMQGNGLK